MPDVTPNRNYPRPEENGHQSGTSFAETLYDAITSIDEDIQEVIDNQNETNETIDTSITNIEADIETIYDDLAELNNGKKDLETLVTSTNMTYDGSNQLLTYEDAKYKFFNTVYTDGKLTRFDELIKLLNVTYRVTLNYTGDNLTSITRTVVA